ncbi:MAG TPA: hypothetical protein ENI87_00750, partial [bacterium]|nr:hypothetical protein [bacterium]
MADRPDNVNEAAGWFELLQEIGRGSSGTVHRARLTHPYRGLPAGTEVAVKFLRPELAGDDKARARLFAEGELGQAIEHANVAHIYGVETLDLFGVETIYLVMQFVAGTTLRELLARSTAPVEDLTRRVGADAASGLSALHRRGLVHRDIKPENLILTPASEVKIVDLGLVRPFDSLGGGSSPGRASAGRSSGFGLHGSVAYSAPEMLGGGRAGPSSDLYALGVVLFELTTGQHPFADAGTVDEMLDAHLNRPAPRASHLRPRVSPFLDQLLAELLAKDPERRPRSAAELARVLAQGERSEWWQRHEAKAPVLASERRLMRMRRPADVPFVDRRDEIQRLDHALQAARAGHGRVLAIAAPASSGRRRLLDEAMQRWLGASEPPILLGGNADSGLGHGEPFASSLLDVLLGGEGRHSPNARARAEAAAGKQLACDERAAEALAAVLFGDSRERSEVRADRIGAALLQLTRPGRTLVVRVDHADDLDTTGRLVMQRLADAAPEHRLLVLLATGPDTALVAAADRLELAGLARRDFLAFGRSLFRQPSDERVTTYLTGACEVLSGLPGSLLEALDHLVEQGRLRGRVGDYHGLADDAEPRPAPNHLERFRLRVAGLEPRQRLALSAAAVLGERCSLAELAAVILEPELSVLETLSLFRGRIVSAQAGEVAFRHRDFRRALLRQLPDDERRRLHAAAASVLEARGAGPLVVGMHRSMALDHQGCLGPLLEALQVRVAAGSRRTALRVVGRLAVHFRHVDDNEANRRLRLRYLLLSGRAHQNADQSEPAARAFRAADRLARVLGDVVGSATALVGLATGELDAGRLLSAIALLETVHDALG